MAYAPLMNNGITGDNVSITLVIADRPLSPTFASYVAPGFIGGDLDAQNVIFNRHQTWAITQDSSSLSNYTVLMNETSGGICSSTASDRIYWGVALLPNVIKVGPSTSTVDSITFPPMRIRIFFNASEEAEYQYLMRLKRSFDLQQSYDVDGRRPH
jgi:hypothetical protein